MTKTEVIAGRPVRIETAELEPVRVRILPNGQIDSNNAAKYVNRAPKTLAMWRMRGIGPPWTKCGGRIFYFKSDLDAFLSGDANNDDNDDDDHDGGDDDGDDDDEPP